jgi:hypothetical protein
VAAALQAAGSKDPNGRFPDANAFRAALAGGPIVTGAPTGYAAPPPPGAHQPATPPAAGYSSAGSDRPNWLSYAIVGGVGVVVFAALLIFAGAGQAPGGSSGIAPNAADGGSAGTATPEAPVAGDLSHLIDVYASSELPVSGSTTYKAANLFDRDPTTCWAEGVAGYGNGETVTFQFREPVYVSRIGSIVGYDKNEGGWDRWITNGRLKSAEFVFSDGERVPLAFDDKRDVQWRSLPSPKKTTSVTMRIVTAYEASASGGRRAVPDTSIAEMAFEGWTAAAVGE